MTKVVRDVFFWNVNGLRARWGAKKLPFSQVISAKDPDLVVLTEVRSSFEKVWGLSGFEQFLLDNNYFFSFFYWNNEGIGKGGVAAFSKRKPLDVLFGLQTPELDVEARVLSLLFDDLARSNGKSN